jgi:hypothetical protein
MPISFKYCDFSVTNYAITVLFGTIDLTYLKKWLCLSIQEEVLRFRQFSVVENSEDYQYCCPSYEDAVDAAYEKEIRNRPVDNRYGNQENGAYFVSSSNQK